MKSHVYYSLIILLHPGADTTTPLTICRSAERPGDQQLDERATPTRKQPLKPQSRSNFASLLGIN